MWSYFFSFNITSSDNDDDVSLGFELGAGGELSADTFIGRTSGDPTPEYSTAYNSSCQAAYGGGWKSGMQVPIDGSPGSTSNGLLFGVGVGCSQSFSWDWGVK